MGAVWLARDELLGRDVAVKQVLVPVGSDPEATEGHREAAMREGRIAARLTHPHAVSVYDMVDDGGTPWLVMEYLPSRSLAQVLTERGTLPVQQVAQIGAQVADALIAVHAAGVIHRDVKPGNILIGEGARNDGVVKITDFGISRARGDVSLTQTGVVKGTPAYLSPEVARGEEPDEASDVFSLGATLYACLEGSPPFGMTENPLEMLYRVAGGDFQRPRNAGTLTRPLMKMLHSDPAKRPSMTEVRDQLAQLAAGRDRDVTEVLTARTPLTPTLTEVRPVGDRVLPVVPPTTEHPAPVEPAAAPVAAGLSAPAAEPTAPQPGAAPEPPAVPPQPPAEPPAPGSRRRRSRLAALAALLILAALVVAFVVIRQSGQGDDRTPTADATTSAPSSAPAPSSTPSQTPTEESPVATAAATTDPTTAEIGPAASVAGTTATPDGTVAP